MRRSILMAYLCLLSFVVPSFAEQVEKSFSEMTPEQQDESINKVMVHLEPELERRARKGFEEEMQKIMELETKAFEDNLLNEAYKLRQKFEEDKQRVLEIKRKEFEEDWKKESEKLEEMRKKMRQDRLTEENRRANEMKGSLSAQFGEIKKGLDKQCSNCMGNATSLEDPSLYVFMSFSLPDQAWIKLSPEVEKGGGTFVLRGLPEQSFQALAARILDLKEKGVNAQIQLDPKKFQEYQVSHVPAFVVAEEERFDKAAGHISLKYALETMAKRGETKLAKTLYQSMRVAA